MDTIDLPSGIITFLSTDIEGSTELAQKYPDPNNQSAQITSFIGRDMVIAEVNVLLHSARLVTLTGSGGTGKHCRHSSTVSG